MTTTKACLLVAVTLAAAGVIGTLLSLALPSWVGSMATGAISAGVCLVFIYPRWKNGRK